MIDRSAPLILVQAKPEGSASSRVDLSDLVLSLEFEDNEKEADKLRLTISNEDLSQFDEPVWRPGMLLEVSWGYPDNMTPAREFVIERRSGGRALTVEARAKSVLMNRVARTRNFENVRRSDVVRQLLEENGWSATTSEIDETDEVLPVVTQHGLTDAQMIRRLAKIEGFEFFVDFDGAHFHGRRLGQRPIRTLRYFDDLSGEIQDFSLDSETTAAPGRVKVKGRDPVTKQEFETTADNASDSDRDVLAGELEAIDPDTGNTALRKNAATETTRHMPGATEKDAGKAAKTAFRDAQRGTVELSVTIVGDPSMIAKSVVMVEGLGKSLSGRYYVKQAAHRLAGGSGYTIALKLASDGTGGYKSSSLVDGYDPSATPPAGKANTAQPDAKREDELAAVERIDDDTGATRVDYQDRRGRGATSTR